MEITILFLENLVTKGDYASFKFKVISQNVANIIVDVSGSLIAIKNEFIPVHIAAKAIEFYFQGLVPQNCYKENKTYIEIWISTSWYPGSPGDPQINKNYKNFNVESPKKEIGFDLD